MDFEFIERVVRLVEEAEIGELEVESKEGIRLVVKKQSQSTPSPTAFYPQMITGTLPPQMAGAPAAAPESPSSPAVEVDESVELIKSPMVGTFYRAPAPDAPPFVETGDVVQSNTVVCILEAMKVMNEIKAGLAGTVQEVMVENGQPVEFGQPLFKIKK
ncbi:MAG: acetyl-CoA carboxylase biotin carboxyl carrier protein [Candidatus Omnitrophica bacterium]|nr:acetyl-CoA carboxylase biotin carboxyl carrier protein [Candidatus Omnitrophota bacterium]